MPKAEPLDIIRAKTFPAFFILDTSGSMAGPRIAALNDAVNDSVEQLFGLCRNIVHDVRIGILEFHSCANWITVGADGAPALEPLEDLRRIELRAGGLTALGSALRELDAQLSRQGLMRSETGFKRPVILFTGDGSPTDDWRPALEHIRQNRWFQHAIRIAFAIGDDADEGVLAEVVGDPKAVVRCPEPGDLTELFRKVSVKAFLGSLG